MEFGKNSIPTLSVIGCGRLGKAITRLFHEHEVFRVVDVLNRSLASSEQAVEFIGAGRPVGNMHDLREVDVTFISAADASIESIADNLACVGNFKSKIVFHASGSLSYLVLNSVARQGALIASTHPMVTFSDPKLAIRAVPGSYCSMEGHPDARIFLHRAFEKIGSNPFDLGDVSKSEYHAAAVFVSNYVTTVIHTGLELFTRVGMDHNSLLTILQPSIRSIVDSLFEEGTTKSLTGPISRGDANVIEGHLDSIKDNFPGKLELYRQLAKATVLISREKGLATSESLDRIDEILDSLEYQPNFTSDRS